ncbi:MAG TPA: hypothetical protein VL588_09780 [Bdellovibrionota bacterium]|jgi:hypothetical protein|nr:hypothetical protein [Bdellovibrionota bacterium]
MRISTRLTLLALTLIAIPAWADDDTRITGVQGHGTGTSPVCSTGDSGFTWCSGSKAQETASEAAIEAARRDAREKCEERHDFVSVASIEDGQEGALCGPFQTPFGPPAVRCSARATARCEVIHHNPAVSGHDHGSHWEDGGLLGGWGGGSSHGADKGL